MRPGGALFEVHAIHLVDLLVFATLTQGLVQTELAIVTGSVFSARYTDSSLQSGTCSLPVISHSQHVVNVARNPTSQAWVGEEYPASFSICFQSEQVLFYQKNARSGGRFQEIFGFKDCVTRATHDVSSYYIGCSNFIAVFPRGRNQSA